ncbi:DNA transformation protein [Pseudorhizobium tarimense]|uniref:DNA transformation protein n=1 Tax=Pseudorhizobium tarimense TaxID=1079109 RepID=A0ABV2H2M5_9HYPH|nr:TfoX/Sxy family protein [Pseudorhizobium tarimense]MCJ8518207.1 TfoX/Sxy family protein [Pseudorhizobium tarimense]
MDNAAIEEMFEPLGPVSIRRMFGGKGIYRNGLILALDVYGEILLKADPVSAPLFEVAGARQWVYESKKGKPAAMPYWSIPEEAVDDPDVMKIWLQLAYEAAVRSQK